MPWQNDNFTRAKFAQLCVNVCDNYFKCQLNKFKCLKVGRPLHTLDILNGKWERISLDFIVGLPTTIQGHDSTRVEVDRLNKICKFIPRWSIVKNPKLARLFMDQLY